jgi:3-oxoacid CoA-transferase subunit A
VRQGAAPLDIRTVEAFRREVMGADALVFNTASIGLYLDTLFDRTGLTEAIRPRTARHPTGEAMLEHLRHGEGRQIGFGAVTEVLLYRDKGVVPVDPLPAEIQNSTRYAATPTARGAGQAEASGLLSFLKSPERLAPFRAAGIEQEHGGGGPSAIAPRPVGCRGVSLGRRSPEPMRKVFPDAREALAGLLRDGMTIMSGGFGLCGIPAVLIEAVRESGVKDLTVVSNNAGIDGVGLGVLLDTRQIRKMVSSYVGENATFAKQYLAGELEIEFNPQGTLAERIRAGGAGIPAFFTKTGVGTEVAKGKPTQEFDGETFVMERGIVADLALVHAYMADHEGNLAYRRTARNFNPIMATAAKVTVAQVEHLVRPGEIDPDHIITPGVFVKRMVALPAGYDKRIEQRTVRKREPAAAGGVA